MKILLDECVPKDLCKSFSGHECRAARVAGFGGKKNGELLDAAERAGFDVLITVDQRIPYRQRLAGRKLSLIIIHAKSNKLEVVVAHAPACVAALRSIKRGRLLRVGDV